MVRFADKTSHQIFLEPEGRHTEEFYVNGVSTSLPLEVQYRFIRTIPGLKMPRSCAPDMPSSMIIARPRSFPIRWKRSASPASISLGKSMAPQATRKPPHKD